MITNITNITTTQNIQRMSRDPRILEDDLRISEKILRTNYENRKMCQHIEQFRHYLRDIVNILDTSNFAENDSSVIKEKCYNHLYYAKSLWHNDRIDKSILSVFQSYIEYLAEAIGHLDKGGDVWKESLAFLERVENSHYNTSNSSSSLTK
uniref:Uncharacterized protein n=1 Tax=viral metagenome TaxID=1070528 RepID=A0A6C0KES3_9ZZZZ